MDTIGIISAGIGNVGSLSNMLNHLGFPSRIIENCKDINNCKKVILPGVGNFFHGMQLLQKGGWVDDIKNFALTEQRPILGICLGMQLMTRSSEEGDVDGLSLVDARTVRFSTIKREITTGCHIWVGTRWIHKNKIIFLILKRQKKNFTLFTLTMLSAIMLKMF